MTCTRCHRSLTILNPLDATEAQTHCASRRCPWCIDCAPRTPEEPVHAPATPDAGARGMGSSGPTSTTTPADHGNAPRNP
jgi:hypothetical protein